MRLRGRASSATPNSQMSTPVWRCAKQPKERQARSLGLNDLESSPVATTPTPQTTSWAEPAIESACRRAEEWYRSLPAFEPRVFVGSGEVIGHKYPALLSERDCVINFARFLQEADVPWDAIHHEVPMSRWLFDAEHPAATKMTPGQRRRTIDLALIKSEDLV